jgi:hypothetical protein
MTWSFHPTAPEDRSGALCSVYPSLSDPPKLRLTPSLVSLYAPEVPPTQRWKHLQVFLTEVPWRDDPWLSPVPSGRCYRFWIGGAKLVLR